VLSQINLILKNIYPICRMTLRASLQTAWASIVDDATEIDKCKGVSNHVMKHIPAHTCTYTGFTCYFTLPVYFTFT